MAAFDAWVAENIGSVPVSDMSNANIFQGIGNTFTGNLDYRRGLDMLSREQSFNASQAAINRQFQKYMSDTAVRRQVADMKAAGINPVLAVANGGASTPSGAAASSTAPSGHSANGFANLLSAVKLGADIYSGVAAGHSAESEARAREGYYNARAGEAKARRERLNQLIALAAKAATK